MGNLIDNRTVNIYNNTVKDIYFSPIANITVVGIYNAAEADSINIFNNTVRSITKNGSGTIMGIYNLLTSTTGTEYIYGNQVYAISAPSATVYGIASSHSGFNNGNRKIHNNMIYELNGNSAVYGIYCFVGGYADIYQNKIYSLSSNAASTNLRGIFCSSVAYKVTLANNMIFSLESPFCGSSDDVYGAYISGVDSLMCFYNTIFLNSSSSSSDFGNICLSAGSIDFIELQGNNLVNLSTPTGAGIVSAFSTNKSLASSAYSPNSGHNNFYAGTPMYGHHLVSSLDGFIETIDNLQNIAAPAESGSISENPPFVNITTMPYDLHLQTGIATLLESGAQRITSPSIPTDYDSDTRWGETAYAGTGVSTDIGADEGNFMSFGLRPPIDFRASNVNSVENRIEFTAIGSPVNNVVIVYNLTGVFTAPSGAPPAIGDAFAGGTLLYNGTTGAPLTHSGLVFGTKYYYAAWSKDALNNYSIRTNSAAVASIDAPSMLGAEPQGSRKMALTWGKNAENHDILVVSSTSAIIGAPVNGTAYVSGTLWGTGETVVYQGSLNNYLQLGLTPYTSYNYKVWSCDALNYYSSTGLTTSKFTYREVPYIQLFTVSTGLPTDWTKNGGFRQYNLHGVHNSIGIGNTIGGTTSSVSSPNIQLTSNPCRLLFDYRLLSNNDFPDVYSQFYTGDSLNVQVSIDKGLSFQTIYSINQSNHYNTPQFKGIIVDLSAWSNQFIMIRFNAIKAAGSTASWLDIDNFIVEEIPTCAYPALPMITNLTNNSASLNWVGEGNNWQLEYGPAGFTHGTGVTINGITANSTIISGLSGSTQYDCYIRKDCGAGVFSDWSDYVSFETYCNPIAAPYEEHFNTTPFCWHFSGPELWRFSPDYSINNDYITDHTSGGGGNLAIVNSSINDSLLTDISMWSPYFDVSSITNLQLRFFLYRNQTITGNNNQSLRVDYWDGATWHNAVFNRQITAATTAWEEVKVYLNEFPASGPVQFRFVVNRAMGNSYTDGVVIDDVYIEEGPVCPPPQYITFSAITPNSAVVDWTQAGPSSLWDIEYGLEPFTIGSGTAISNQSVNHLILPSLSASSTYRVNIRTNCGTTYSDWASSELFSTPCESVTSLWVEDFEGGVYPPSCWEMINSGVMNQWQVSTLAGGYGASSSSLMVNFYGWVQTNELETWPFDVSSLGSVQFKFDFAYATYVNEVDQLDIYYSTDYGDTYSLLESMPGGLTGILNTAGATFDLFVPTASQWATQALNLPVGTNRIKFTGIGVGGNLLYIDNVRVEGTSSGSKVLNLKLFTEGLYAGASTMNKAKGSTGDAFLGSIADKITVELRSGSAYSTMVYAEANVSLNTDGNASLVIPDMLNGTYYIKVGHRNSLALVSSSSMSFAGSSLSYDFTTSASKASGNNQVDLGGGVFGMFGGDVNQDGIIDALDLILIDNDASNLLNGYLSTDINGDGIIDLLDINMAATNAAGFKAVVTP
jgi:hypothetical protein